VRAALWSALTVLLDPVGVDEARRILVRVRGDSREERVSIGHGVSECVVLVNVAFVQFRTPVALNRCTAGSTRMKKRTRLV
jgi:hypothetical protein